MSKVELKWRVIYKERIVNRKTNDVTYLPVAEEKDADNATLYTALPTDYTKASDDVKLQVKTKLLALASAHVDKAGRFRYLADEVFISAKGAGINLYENPITILATETVDLP